MTKVEQIIRQVLAEVERGEVASIAIATVAPDLATGSPFTLGDGTLAELLGAIDLTKHRTMRKAEDYPLD